MPNSTPASNRSAHFRTSPDGASARIRWQPSRLLQVALGVLTACACLSIWLSELPALLSWSAMPLLLVAGAHRIRLEARRPTRLLVIDVGGTVTLDGQRLDDARLHWRGPILRLDWREAGRGHALLWWPDTLPPARRRELRLASAALAAPPRTESMAP